MNFLRNALAELLGTLAFGFLSLSSCLFTEAWGITYLTPLFFGLSFMVAYYSYMPFGRGHFDPSLGFSLLLTKKEGILEFVFNGIGQFVGMFLAALTTGGLYLLVGNSRAFEGPSYPVYSLRDGISGLSLMWVFFFFAIMTAVFSFFYLQVKSRKEYNAASGLILALGYALFGALSILVVHGIPYVGQPFLALATNIVASFLPNGGSADLSWSETWIYVLAPFLGAAFGASIYVLLNHRLNKLKGIRIKDVR